VFVQELLSGSSLDRNADLSTHRRRIARRFPPVATGDASPGLSGGRQSCLRPSVGTLDRGELLVAEADAAEHVQDEVRLAKHVAVDVGWELDGKPPLQVAVVARGVRVRTEIVSSS
jgi:hypothetical protein